jgi:alanine transaminase
MGNADIGAYSFSTGYAFVRENVCKFLKRRDGYGADPNHIVLTNGASEGVRIILEVLLGRENEGILLPIP